MPEIASNIPTVCQQLFWFNTSCYILTHCVVYVLYTKGNEHKKEPDLRQHRSSNQEDGSNWGGLWWWVHLREANIRGMPKITLQRKLRPVQEERGHDVCTAPKTSCSGVRVQIQSSLQPSRVLVADREKAQEIITRSYLYAEALLSVSSSCRAAVPELSACRRKAQAGV